MAMTPNAQEMYDYLIKKGVPDNVARAQAQASANTMSRQSMTTAPLMLGGIGSAAARGASSGVGALRNAFQSFMGRAPTGAATPATSLPRMMAPEELAAMRGSLAASRGTPMSNITQGGNAVNVRRALDATLRATPAVTAGAVATDRLGRPQEQPYGESQNVPQAAYDTEVAGFVEPSASNPVPFTSAQPPISTQLVDTGHPLSSAPAAKRAVDVAKSIPVPQRPQREAAETGILGKIFSGQDYQSTGRRVTETPQGPMQKGQEMPTTLNWGSGENAADFVRASQAMKQMQDRGESFVGRNEMDQGYASGGNVKPHKDAALHKALEIIHALISRR